MISAEDLEKAEKVLSRTYQIAVGAQATHRVLDRARIDRIAAEKFLVHHKQVLFARYLPDVDPRTEPAVMTMLLHMLCVGAVSQRMSDHKDF